VRRAEWQFHCNYGSELYTPTRPYGFVQIRFMFLETPHGILGLEVAASA
jgi:hypothetical protein